MGFASYSPTFGTILPLYSLFLLLSPLRIVVCLAVVHVLKKLGIPPPPPWKDKPKIAETKVGAT